MKIALAQIRTIKGDILRNIQNHLKFIDLAVDNSADLILFPELSITGYEPELAKTLAVQSNDSKFDSFQKISNDKGIVICLGAPTQNDQGICISLLIFQPNLPIQIYSKEHLHCDETPFFIAGTHQSSLLNSTSIALAICYEVFVEAHAQKAQKKGATIYLASVAKSEKGIKKAFNRLPQIAKENSLLVLMCNNVGLCDNFEATGQSAAWNKNGTLIGQLDNLNEGLLIIDTINQTNFNAL